jgi:hypothetical protein
VSGRSGHGAPVKETNMAKIHDIAPEPKAQAEQPVPLAFPSPAAATARSSSHVFTLSVCIQNDQEGS